MPPSQQSRIGGRAIQQIGGTRKASTLVVAPLAPLVCCITGSYPWNRRPLRRRFAAPEGILA
jgi:hypothetical protein